MNEHNHIHNRAYTTYSADQGPSLADAFEYVMYGKVYRIEGGEGPGDSGRL